MTAPLRLAVALSAAVALAPAARAEVKLGYVDMMRAMSEVDEGKVAQAQLKKDFDEKQKVVDEKQEELKKLKADFDKQSVLMSDQAKAVKQAELERKFGEAQQLVVQLQKELAERRDTVTGGIIKRMRAIIEEISAAEGITMVFEREGLLYANASLDLSNEVIRKYNARYGAGAAAAKKPDTGAAKPTPAAAKK